jgi:sterol desaturase/sphingolipid hydroxylase (fatty acid hydroxylase superfamily)
MDWLMSARFHPVNAAVVTVLVTVPLRMLGFAFAVAGAAGLVMYALNLFEHANVRIDVPGLRWIVPNPAFHHWHHAVDTPNCNYGQFPFVDAIFGTAHLPKDARPSVFGLHEPVPNEGYVEQLLHPLRRPAPQALAVARGDAG